MAAKRIGILTGGGDVPGLNSVIKTVVYRGSEIGCEVIGIRRGWEGLTHVNLQDPASRTRYVLPLNRENTRTIDRTGGTYLHSSRTNPSKMKKLPPVLEGQDFPVNEFTKKGVTSKVFDVTKAVLKNIETLNLDYLIAIGGDDTLSYAAELDRQGFRVIAVPKTMDNDVQNTEYCIGFSTAITRAMDAIERQRTTVGSHERVGLFRVFGRDAGYTALYTAYVTSVRCCIPEYKVELPKLIELLVTDKKNNPSNYSLAVLSEGAEWEGYTVKEYGEADAFGHRKKMSVAEDLSNEIKNATGEETIVSDLTYDLRSGSADFVDRMVASTFAGMAMDAIAKGQHGLMTAISNGCFHDGRNSRSQTRTAPRGGGHHVQYRALPSHLRPKSRPADFPDTGIGRRIELEAAFFQKARRAAHPRVARPHSDLVRRSRARRGALSLHHRSPHLSRQADPRTSGRSRRPPRAGRRLRQGPLCARLPGTGTAAELWGLDISEEMLRYVPAGIHTRAGAMTELPFEDGFFDGAYATESLEHAVEIEKAVSEICRVVKPGGRIAIIDKNAEHWGRLHTPEWEKWFTRKELERLLRRDCREVSSRFVSYWEDVEPDGLFLAWLAVK